MEYKEGDKVYFQRYEDGPWYEGIIHNPYINGKLLKNIYSIVGTNIKIHCFAPPARLQPRKEKEN